MNTKSLPDWVDKRQSQGVYTFTLSEAAAAMSLSAGALQRSLHRLQSKGRIARVRNGFFVIVPLEYAVAGAPPASWFIDPLMRTIGLPYYVGLLTAAGLHGASHQQPQEFQVMTTRPMRAVAIGRVRITFFVNKDLSRAATMQMKTPTGSIEVSPPEMTALDLVRYSKGAGYIGNVATVLHELIPQIKPKELARLARRLGHPRDVRRLGYLLDHVGGRALTGPLKDAVMLRPANPVLLRPDRIAADIDPDRRWGVVANELIEVEA